MAAFANDDIDAYTIIPADLGHRDAPRAGRFPARHLPASSPATLVLTPGSPAWQFRGRLTAAPRTANFAGALTLVWWGCGSACQTAALIDRTTGQVYLPDALRDIQTNNLSNRIDAEGGLIFRPDSELLIVLGTPGDPSHPRGVNYYRWHQRRLIHLYSVPRPYPGQ
ncbi:hypothetical protein [Jeongeupia chitinilytica]|uniref:Glucose/Sorbosone dehydrogenase domain-containing protein n=1 Tax=Jeongeupia chitinilytica TaxID=1041641 RepID=A0ABQ3H2K9_9NEIS|nr:hypothetical protein [Jeongeupia chitinilytica]GHD67060.1 hypothetical protein GCM10007350_30220 [Jeongeupia chitinilytica]